MSDVMWIAVPQGRIREGKAVLSVVVTPRLTESLAAAGIGDWPTALSTAEVRVQTVRRGAPPPTVRSPWRHCGPRPAARTSGSSSPGTSRSRRSRARGYHPPAVAKTSDDADKVRATYAAAVSAMGAPETVEQQLQEWQGAAPVLAQPEPDEPVRRGETPTSTSPWRGSASTRRCCGCSGWSSTSSSTDSRSPPPTGRSPSPGPTRRSPSSRWTRY